MIKIFFVLMELNTTFKHKNQNSKIEKVDSVYTVKGKNRK